MGWFEDGGDDEVPQIVRESLLRPPSFDDIWALPWLGLGAVLISSRAQSAVRSQAPVVSGR